MNYKDKYIKYKTKYLNFTKQYAGSGIITPVVLLCSHQGRIACLIHDITGKILDKNLQNCSIVKLSIIDDSISLEIVYVGEIICDGVCSIAEKNKYYGETFKFALNKTAKKKIKNIFKKNIVIYMVRHGDGKHLVLKRKGVFAKIGQNIADRFKSSENKILRDARLTIEGIEQAQRAGEELNCLLDNDFIDFIFFSDLERTRQTIAGMLSKIESKKISKKVRTIVLPCSHEVEYKKDGSNCDGIGFLEDVKRRFITENIPRVDNIDEFPLYMKISNKKDLKIDISSYSDFYNPEQTKEKLVSTT